MIIGFSKHGTGGGAKPIKYLTAETVGRRALDYLTGGKGKNGLRRDPAPFVVRGDPERTKALIDSLRFKHRYTSGVLSFAPDEKITLEMERSIIDQFERTAFAGLNPDQYDILWVRHQHTSGGRHELHFITPRVELSSGRSLNIAPPRKSTREMFDTLRTKINLEFRMADPEDPARARKSRAPEIDGKRSGGLERENRSTRAPQQIRELEEKLQKLTKSRGEYHKTRYVTKEPQPTLRPEAPLPNLTPYDRIGTSTPGNVEAPGMPLCRTGTGVRGLAQQFNETTHEWSRANERLERAVGNIEPAVREITIAAEQEAEVTGGWGLVGSILLRFAIPIRSRSNEISDRDSEEIEPDMDIPQ
jgi:hypothetical protein